MKSSTWSRIDGKVYDIWRIRLFATGVLLWIPATVVVSCLLFSGPVAFLWIVALGIGFFAGGLLYLERRLASILWFHDPHTVQYVSGVLFRKHQILPIRQVQAVEVVQGPIEMSFGLAHLSVRTGSSMGSLSLPGFSADEAESLRGILLGVPNG
ncbi:PH domain-containing protein [Nocardia sp. NPDC003963]